MAKDIKNCCTCHQNFPATPEFFYVRTSGNLEYQCKKCAGKRKQKLDHGRADRVRRRRTALRAWLKAYKQARKCLKCPQTDWRTFEFHHRDPAEKDINPSQMMKRGWSIPRVEAELAKCDLLCANCHRIEHYDDWEAESTATDLYWENVAQEKTEARRLAKNKPKADV